METTLIEGVTAVDVLKKDHEIIRGLLRRVERSGSDHRKKLIGDRCLREIETHRVVEEKVFYPAVRRDLGEERLVAQALEEQAVVQRLVDELRELPAGERYNARFRELADRFDAHVDKEEAGLLVLVERSDMDIEQLGAQLAARRRRVQPGRFESVEPRTVAAVAAGVALLGGALWAASRLAGGRRVRA